MAVLGSSGLCQIWRGEYFSQPLNLRFQTDPEWDGRSYPHWLDDSPIFLRDYLLEQIVHKHPTRGGR